MNKRRVAGKRNKRLYKNIIKMIKMRGDKIKDIEYYDGVFWGTGSKNAILEFKIGNIRYGIHRGHDKSLYVFADHIASCNKFKPFSTHTTKVLSKHDLPSGVVFDLIDEMNDCSFYEEEELLQYRKAQKEKEIEVDRKIYHRLLNHPLVNDVWCYKYDDDWSGYSKVEIELKRETTDEEDLALREFIFDAVFVKNGLFECNGYNWEEVCDGDLDMFWYEED